MNEMKIERRAVAATRPARLGFLGTGWIGRHRMQAILDTKLATAVAIADPSTECAKQAAALAPDANIVSTLDELLDQKLDGLVIATPSAQHAEQSLQALQAGIAVFCQKPLGRSAREVKEVVDASRAADRLLGVDLSYRHTNGMRQIKQLIDDNAFGDVFALDLTFHNAYGPDKSWFYDRRQAGGGCLIDLGIHLVDLALWSLSFPQVAQVTGNLLKEGKLLPSDGHDVEDFAVATLTLENGSVIRVTCSWRLQAGYDAGISAEVYGTAGGAAFRNVDGSFYDFAAHRFFGTRQELLVEPPDDWGGRAAIDWVSRLASGQSGYDPESQRLVDVADVLDRIYRSAGHAI